MTLFFLSFGNLHHVVACNGPTSGILPAQYSHFFLLHFENCARASEIETMPSARNGTVLSTQLEPVPEHSDPTWHLSVQAVWLAPNHSAVTTQVKMGQSL